MAENTPDNFDDLLDLTNDDAEQPTPEPTPEPVSPPDADPLDAPEKLDAGTSSPSVVVEEDAEDRRIRELKAALAATPAVPAPLTEKQREIQDLEDQLARRTAAAVEHAEPVYSDTVADGEKILIHVVLDGFTALGEVWYRGQELEFVKGSPDYLRTVNRRGESWLDLAHDVQGQYDRWGKQYIAPGPFVGLRHEKFDDEIAKADARRGRRVPIVRA